MRGVDHESGASRSVFIIRSDIQIDSEMNILLAFTTIWVMYNAYLTKDIGFLKQNILMPLIVK